MTTIFHTADADRAAIEGQRLAVVGYGNQGRSWALNLRDSGVDVRVCVRADPTREAAEADGFATQDIEAANDADILCLLVPDDVIPSLPLRPGAEALVIVASGFCPAFGRLELDCDVGMVAPRMLGPEVRRCYEEGVGFITAVGVHLDRTGTALARTLAVADAIGGLRQGALALTPHQEAVLDLAVEQALAPAMRRVSQSFVEVMLSEGIPLEAILTELFLSGEVERSYRLGRLEGYAGQLEHHSPTSPYGQLARADRFDHLDVAITMRDIVANIANGGFADEWEAEHAAGHPTLKRLKAAAVGPDVIAFEQDLRSRLGELAVEPR
ncbi:MAG TPA: NAD(P)-binding domain-containing protein [Acidimicrobiales bacterium]|nr:NAD(P)-binding domain-containing protein [Acidimicrobiales bacterium]